MRTSWMLLACLIVITGCQQQAATIRPSQANRPVQPLGEIVDEQDAEPAVVPASHETTDDSQAGPQFVINVQHVDLLSKQPPVASLLKKLWASVESAGEEKESRCRTMATSNILSLIQPLEAHGLAKVTSQPPIVATEGTTGHWSDAGVWNVTPTGNADDSIHIALAGAIADPSSPANPSLWKTAADADLRPGETLVLEGNAFNVHVVEVSRTAYVGDLPIIGQFFTTKVAIREPHQSLYLVTVEAVVEKEPLTK